jgi:hypothetical protein
MNNNTYNFWVKLDSSAKPSKDSLLVGDSVFVKGDITWRGDNLSLNQINEFEAVERKIQAAAMNLAKLSGRPLTALDLLKTLPEASSLLADPEKFNQLLEVINISEQRSTLNNAVLEDPSILTRLATQKTDQYKLNYKKISILWNYPEEDLLLLEHAPGAYSLKGNGFIEELSKETEVRLSDNEKK